MLSTAPTARARRAAGLGHGAGREAGAARDWQGWPARSRARLRARGRQPWGDVHGKNNVRSLEGPEGGALAAFGSCGARCLPEQLPWWGLGAGWVSSGLRAREHRPLAALAPWQASLSPPQRLFLLRRGRTGSRGARLAPCWIGVYAGVSAQAVESIPSLPCALAPLFWSMPTLCLASHVLVKSEKT